MRVCCMHVFLGATLDARLHRFEVQKKITIWQQRKIYYAIQSYTEFQVICLVATASSRSRTH